MEGKLGSGDSGDRDTADPQDKDNTAGKSRKLITDLPRNRIRYKKKKLYGNFQENFQ